MEGKGEEEEEEEKEEEEECNEKERGERGEKRREGGKQTELPKTMALSLVKLALEHITIVIEIHPKPMSVPLQKLPCGTKKSVSSEEKEKVFFFSKQHHKPS